MHIDADSDGRGVDIELNIVPYIDMMSCLTAFLLITAVWTNNAQIPVAPKGVGHDGTEATAEREVLSVLVTSDAVLVGTASGQIRSVDTGDLLALDEALLFFRDLPSLQARRDVEFAADDGVSYGAAIAAMDAAVGVGFDDIGFVDPASLSVRFRH